MRAILLLNAWKTRNALRTLFTDPRKFVPFLVIALGVGSSLFFGMIGAGRQPTQLDGPPIDPSLVHSVVFFVMFLLAVGTIDSGLGDGLLAFALPDIDYLFPSPISRRFVLLCKLPGFTFGATMSGVFLLYMFNVFSLIAAGSMPHAPGPPPSLGLSLLALALCTGTFLNLAMFAAVQFKNRQILHRVLIGLLLGSVAGVLLLGWFKGIHAATAVILSPAVQDLFYPVKLATDALMQRLTHRGSAVPIEQLGLLYVVSLIPMFATNANFYEQSIASSERVASYRKAAKGGWSSIQAAQASKKKFKATRTYTVKPFGLGAGALFWAHLAAAGKKPYINFLLPALSGVAVGALGTVISTQNAQLGAGALGFLGVYLSIGFMATARTSSEACIRRRELISPLPIAGWQVVMANLGVPLLAVIGFSLGVMAPVVVGRAPYLGMLAFGLTVLYPLRLGTRMVLQYIVVLAYPDLADRVQQLLAQGVYYFVATPFVIAEVIICIPAIFLHSIWIGMISLTVLEIGLGFFFVWLAGIANDRSVSSGEPVKLFRLLSANG